MSLSINPDIFYDCNNECLYDLDGDGICDELELPEMILYDLPDSIVYSYTVEDSILANESFFACNTGEGNLLIQGFGLPSPLSDFSDIYTQIINIPSIYNFGYNNNYINDGNTCIWKFT